MDEDLTEAAHRPEEHVSGGVPSWLAAALNYCSRCGAALRFGSIDGDHRERLACSACGFVAYVNPRLVVTTLPITEGGEVVLLGRGGQTPGRSSSAPSPPRRSPGRRSPSGPRPGRSATGSAASALTSTPSCSASSLPSDPEGASAERGAHAVEGDDEDLSRSRPDRVVLAAVPSRQAVGY